VPVAKEAAASHRPPSPPPPPPPLAPPKEALHDVSLTVSAVRLLSPVLEAHVEVRLGPLGLSAFGGIGQVTVEREDEDDLRLKAYELGAIAMVYPIETFESLALGAELLWLKVSDDELEEDGLTGFASGVAVGPLLGYKSIGRTGFTFVAQGGVAYIAVHAEASDDWDSAEADDEQWVPLLNLNLGWSF
jgi:hypothetical protein